MTPYHADDWLTVYQGDCRAVMAEMEPESVHCVVTSPPYWGLRDYGTASWEGGDEGCDHVERMARGDAGRVSTDDRGGNINPTPVETPIRFKAVCGKCGARRIDDQLGLESTPEAYVASMVAVFREVKRVLRSDGTVWLNLGDSYASGGERATGRNDTDRDTPGGRGGSFRGGERRSTGQRDGLKPKDLVGIPWRVAFALQADGWYLRSDIIWAKPNPMPESVTDRPTKAHEYLFLLSKSPRYYYDADAVREPHAEPWRGNGEHESSTPHSGRLDDPAKEQAAFTVATRQYNPAGRNLRSVWNIATAPYPGAHFATFPPKLVEPCIKAGASEKGVCPECGAPWVREVERETVPARTGEWKASGEAHRNDIDRKGGFYPTSVDRGWSPSCGCEHDGGGWVPIPATVLDPFAGSGTTGMVAQRLSRRAVLIDLSVDYLRQLMERNRDLPLGLGA